MKVKYMSDIHLEFGGMKLEHHEDNKDTVLILAGDISTPDFYDRFSAFIDLCSREYHHVIFVSGNHEFYNGEIVGDSEYLQEIINRYDNVTFLDDDTFTIDDVTFIGSTLWTSFNDGDWFSMQSAKNGMNDFRIIKYTEGTRFTPELALSVNIASKLFIKEELEKYKDKKTVVVTHHAPAEASQEAKFANSPLKYCFVNHDLEDMIIDLKPDFWVHGHLHSTSDYMIGDTNILCNPRGYHGYEINPNFTQDKYFEL